jgi:hypothetical protein
VRIIFFIITFLLTGWVLAQPTSLQTMDVGIGANICTDNHFETGQKNLFRGVVVERSRKTGECAMEGRRLRGLFSCESIIVLENGVTCLTFDRGSLDLALDGSPLHKETRYVFSLDSPAFQNYSGSNLLQNSEVIKFPPVTSKAIFDDGQIHLSLRPDLQTSSYEVHFNQRRRTCKAVSITSEKVSCDDETLFTY